MKINLFLSSFSLVVGVSQAWHIRRSELISPLSLRDQLDGTTIAGVDNIIDDGYHGNARMLEGSEYEKCEGDIQTMLASNYNLRHIVHEFHDALSRDITVSFTLGVSSNIYIDDDSVASLKNACAFAGGTMKTSRDELLSLKGDSACDTDVEISNYAYCVASSRSCNAYPIHRPLQKIIAGATGCVAVSTRSYDGGDGGALLMCMLIVGGMIRCLYRCVHGHCCCDHAAPSQQNNPQSVEMPQLLEGNVLT